MKIGAIVLTIGIIVFCLGLIFGRIEGVFERKLGILSIILSILTGSLLWGIGIVSLFTSYTKNQSGHVEPRKDSFRKPTDSRVTTFLIRFGTVVFFGLLILYATALLFCQKEPLFYQLAIPGLFFGALSFALSEI